MAWSSLSLFLENDVFQSFVTISQESPTTILFCLKFSTEISYCFKKNSCTIHFKARFWPERQIVQYEKLSFCSRLKYTPINQVYNHFVIIMRDILLKLVRPLYDNKLYLYYLYGSGVYILSWLLFCKYFGHCEPVWRATLIYECRCESSGTRQ